MYEPTLASIRSHSVPEWFHNAKLGIFIHWGLYSLPGWAPTTGPLHEVIASQGWQGWFRRNPYAEWYMNSIRVPGGVSQAYHAETYGADFAYEQFAPLFNAGLANWNPAEWSALFKDAGAQYVILTTKHHDGFLLWPSAHPNPYIAGYHTERDLVGELSAAVRARGMTMGLYYSGGLDWTFNNRVIADISDLFQGIPQQQEYIDYANGHWHELIERYAPSVLWNDIGYPAGADLPSLFAEYYNRIPEGLVNDRFLQARQNQPAGSTETFATEPVMLRPEHFDFRTPEYAVFNEVRAEKWESCRGLGFSFGYNRNETPETMLGPDELIRSFADIVSKNGNLLLNVGPMGDGTIPQEQRDRLLALGRWLSVNGDAIYGTRPWKTAEGRTTDGTSIRYTRRDEQLYAILLDTPRSSKVTIEGLAVPEGGEICLLGNDTSLVWEQHGETLTVTMPETLPEAPAHTLSLPVVE